MRAIITVIGQDQMGIIARVCTCLYERSVNVLDITQTLLQEYFTMVTLVDLNQCTVPFGQLQADLAALGETMGLSVRIQSEEIFDAMHKI